MAEIRKSGSWSAIIEKKLGPYKIVKSRIPQWDLPIVSITLDFKNAASPFTEENVNSAIIGFRDLRHAVQVIINRPELTTVLTSLAVGPMTINKPIAFKLKSSGNEPAYSLDIKVDTEIIKLGEL